MGVSEESKAYGLFDPISKKILINKDVIFEEQKNWKWKENEEECKQNVLNWEEDVEVESEIGEKEEQNNDIDDSTRSGTHSEPHNHDHENPI